jgi:predicted metalloprotease
MKPSINQMSTQDIVRNSDEVRKSGLDWKKVYVILHQSIESGQYRIMRCNNTLFWYRIDKKGEAQIFLLNADSPRKLIRNFQEFGKAMVASGFKKIYGITADPKIIQALRSFGYSTEVEHMGEDQNGQEQYKVTVNV